MGNAGYSDTGQDVGQIQFKYQEEVWERCQEGLSWENDF